jgi:hypothetical protein
MIRMNKKCPLCRANSKYANIRDLGKKKSIKNVNKNVSKFNKWYTN